jgi:Fe-S-cluster containining protein
VRGWRCQRSSDCCRLPDGVRLTLSEAQELRQASPGTAATFRPTDDPRFLVLDTTPQCPYLGSEPARMRWVCRVYPVRPYNCRRYGCFRADVTQPLDPAAALPAAFWRSRDVRRQMGLLQRRAQPWARAHGWREDDEPCATGS